MSRPNLSAAESASAVSAALVPRSAELSTDIYRLIVREIPVLRGDQRVLALLEASVAENIATMLHILQHGIDLEHVRAPAAAEEYARRIRQAEESLRHQVAQDRLRIEVALLAAQWLGPAVLRPNDARS